MTLFSSDDEDDKEVALERVQSLLLRGNRAEAVEEAIACRDFATALLIASMCDGDTYRRAAKEYAENAFMAASPMHTVAMLFSGGLQAPPANATQSDHWGVEPTELKQAWKQHLAAILSNRTLGWDRIVLSLGDRLEQIGEFEAAHFCFMVCGCPVTNPMTHSTRIALLGCDHRKASNLLLMSNEAVLAYERTEAYEWTKRLGNQNAAIQSFLPFKAVYAMVLAHLGLKANAGLVLKSIRRCSSIPPIDEKEPRRATVKELFKDRGTLSYVLGELELKLGLSVVPQKGESKDTSDEIKKESLAKGPPKIKENVNSTPRGANGKEGMKRGLYTPVESPPVHPGTMPYEMDPDESFITARTNLMDRTGYDNSTLEKPLRQAPDISLNAKDSVTPKRGTSTPDYGVPVPTEIAQTPQQNPNNPPTTNQVPNLQSTPKETRKKQSPPRTAPPVMMGKKKDKATAKSKEPPSSSESKFSLRTVVCWGLRSNSFFSFFNYRERRKLEFGDTRLDGKKT